MFMVPTYVVHMYMYVAGICIYIAMSAFSPIFLATVNR